MVRPAGGIAELSLRSRTRWPAITALHKPRRHGRTAGALQADERADRGDEHCPEQLKELALEGALSHASSS